MGSGRLLIGAQTSLLSWLVCTACIQPTHTCAVLIVRPADLRNPVSWLTFSHCERFALPVSSS